MRNERVLRQAHEQAQQCLLGSRLLGACMCGMTGTLKHFSKLEQGNRVRRGGWRSFLPPLPPTSSIGCHHPMWWPGAGMKRNFNWDHRSWIQLGNCTCALGEQGDYMSWIHLSNSACAPSEQLSDGAHKAQLLAPASVKLLSSSSGPPDALGNTDRFPSMMKVLMGW